MVCGSVLTTKCLTQKMLSDSASLQRASNKTAYAVQLVGSPVNVARFGANVHPIKKPRAKTCREYGNLRSVELGDEW